MWWLRSWRHERSVRAEGAGCVLEDRLTAVPRLPGFGWVARALVRLTFRHRHRRLAARFGAP